MKRIFLFILTNLAVMLVLGIVINLFGFNRFITENGLQLAPLLGFAMVIGFGGAIISLLISKPMAKWSTKAQVGRPDRQTPTFRDKVEYLELNPTWTVPPTILKDDILPKARVNPGYVAKKGLKAIDRNGRTVPLSAVNWNHPAGSFPYTLRQDGGGQKAAAQGSDRRANSQELPRIIKNY